MPSEKSIQKTLIKALNSMVHTKAIKLHTSGFQEAGTPDVLCVSFKMPFMFECKKPGGHLSDIQQVRIFEWEDAGVNCIVCYSAESALTYLIETLSMDQTNTVLMQHERNLDYMVFKIIKNFL